MIPKKRYSFRRIIQSLNDIETNEVRVGDKLPTAKMFKEYADAVEVAHLQISSRKPTTDQLSHLNELWNEVQGLSKVELGDSVNVAFARLKFATMKYLNALNHTRTK